MRLIFFIALIFLITNCSKQETVLICGDHICINKSEAEQYFEENLTIEVKVINKKYKENTDLVKLNLQNNSSGEKKIILSSQKKTNKNLKVLSNDEISAIKKNIKNKKKEKKYVKKTNKDSNLKKLTKNKKKREIKKDDEIINLNLNKVNKDVFDICTILKKCSIDEISKYLQNQGKKKDYPDITLR